MNKSTVIIRYLDETELKGIDAYFQEDYWWKSKQDYFNWLHRDDNDGKGIGKWNSALRPEEVGKFQRHAGSFTISFDDVFFLSKSWCISKNMHNGNMQTNTKGRYSAWMLDEGYYPAHFWERVEFTENLFTKQ